MLKHLKEFPNLGSRVLEMMGLEASERANAENFRLQERKAARRAGQRDPQLLRL